VAPLSPYIYQIRSRFTLYYITLPIQIHNIVLGRVPRNKNQTSTSTAVTILFNRERFEYIHPHQILNYINVFGKLNVSTVCNTTAAL